MTLSEPLLHPTQVEGRAEAEGKQRWLCVDGLYNGRNLCGADWAVCWMYAGMSDQSSCLDCVSMLMPLTAFSSGPDNLILKNSSVQLTVPKGRIASL